MNNFDWPLFPKAESFLHAELDKALSRSTSAATVVDAIRRKTSTKIFDWVDHLAVPSQQKDIEELLKLGFHEFKKTDDLTVLRLEESTFFPLFLKSGKSCEVALAVEDIERFRKIHAKNRKVEGSPYSGFRKLVLVNEGEFQLSAVERRGSSGYAAENDSDVEAYIEATEALGSRKRAFNSSEEGISETQTLLNDFGAKVAKKRLADAFFRSERRYYESRNHAAQVEKNRHDEVGAGWGNVDHHTFRSSRQNFAALIRIFESLGQSPVKDFTPVPKRVGERKYWRMKTEETLCSPTSTYLKKKGKLTSLIRGLSRETC